MKDLTKGKSLSLILGFALPIGIGLLFQLFYSLADTRIVGSYLGEDALAAVGATQSLNSMLIGFLNGLTNGFAIIVARHFGAGKIDKMKRAVGATFVLGIGIALGLTVVSVAFLSPILKGLQTPSKLIPVSVSYFRVILLGMTTSMLYNLCSALLRAIGDSVTPLIFLIASALLNVGLDILFVGSFGMGVCGAAIATVIAQSLACLASFGYLWKRYEILHFTRMDLHVRWKVAKELLSTGVSMGFMSSLINIGSVALQGAINSLDNANIIVAHTAARKISEMFMLPFTIFGTTMATYCGQNKGADRPDRVKKGLLQVIVITWIWCAGVVVAAYTIAPILIRMVTATDQPEIIDTASLYLRMNTILYFIPAVICILRQGMQGIGDTVTPIVSSSVELLCKVAVAVFLTPFLGYWAVILSEPIAWIFMVIPLLVQFFRNPFIRRASAGTENE